MRRSMEWTFPIESLWNTNNESNHCSGLLLLHLIDYRLYHQYEQLLLLSHRLSFTGKLHWLSECSSFSLHSAITVPRLGMSDALHVRLVHLNRDQSILLSAAPSDKVITSKVCGQMENPHTGDLEVRTIMSDL